MQAWRAIHNLARLAAYIYPATLPRQSAMPRLPLLAKDPMHSYTAVSTRRPR